jgi:hypothetical protein
MATPESKELDQEVRVLLHGRKNRTYKIYFSIQPENSSSGLVSVFHVRHWARRPLTREEFEEVMEDGQDQTIESP